MVYQEYQVPQLGRNLGDYDDNPGHHYCRLGHIPPTPRTPPKGPGKNKIISHLTSPALKLGFILATKKPSFKKTAETNQKTWPESNCHTSLPTRSRIRTIRIYMDTRME